MTSATSWGLELLTGYQNPACPDPIWSAESDEALLEKTLAIMEARNIFGVTSGPLLDDLLALMWAHPQAYADVGVISFALPPAGFHRYLRTIVETGFGERVMFGSDQMVWPGAIEFAIDNIESAEYLTTSQKRDILYNNAARFLRLS